MDCKLPTRLIYVSDNDQGVRLCITKDINRTNNADLKYASLTHCWGTKEMFLTTPKNIETMLCNIPVTLLTKTFRDAINITRRLNLQYLWIDSICIIQEDEGDWARESATMAAVYAGCFVNLVASAAPDGTVGCLFDRNRDYEYGFKAFVRSEKEEDQPELWNFFPEGPGDGYTGTRACK
jgi:Heterokaryon incompatibility protein (HET)